MRAAPQQPCCPDRLRLRGGSPLAGSGEAALQLGLFSQLKFSFQLRPAQRSRARGRALRRLRAASGPVALPTQRPGAPPGASFWPGPARLLPWAALLPPGSPVALLRARSRYSSPGSFLFRGEARPRQLAGRKCRSLEPRAEPAGGVGPLPASALKRRGRREGLLGARSCSPAGRPVLPPARRSGEGPGSGAVALSGELLELCSQEVTLGSKEEEKRAHDETAVVAYWWCG